MTRGVRLYLVGSFVLVSLAGCGRGFFQSEEREPWRAEAEIACLKSGAVKESADLVRINPISGPGVCGAEFPLKVAAFGESSSSFGFADDDLRPPATVGNQPRWPISQAPPQPPPYPGNATRQPGYGAGSSGPISLTAPGVTPEQDEIELPPEGTPELAEQGVRQPYGAQPYPSRDRYSRRLRRVPARPIRRRLHRCRRLGTRAGQFGCRVRAGGGQAGRHAGLSDRLGARPLARRFRAARRDALVRPARRRDQADLGLFLPRHERQSERAYFRARLWQCARHRGVHPCRRTAHFGAGRLEGSCRKSRAFCATCRPPPASISPPCWRRAPTPITTIIFTST